MANPKLVAIRSTHLITSDLQMTGSRVQRTAQQLIKDIAQTTPSFVLVIARRSLQSCDDFLSSVEVYVQSRYTFDRKQVIVSNQCNGGLRDLDTTLFIEHQIVVENGSIISSTPSEKVMNQKRPLWHMVGTFPYEAVGGVQAA
jgi:hypothetical protein